MGKTRGVHETTPELRNRMVGMYEAGLGLREIAAAVNCSQRTVKRWLNRFDKEGTVETRDRCGRKRATTVEQDEAIIRLATQTPITAAKAVLPVLGLTCSVDTIRERLHKAGIHNWSPSRKYMQRIPLGDTDGAAVQQPVWRPTGTQLGKKKSSKGSNKNEKSSIATKKKSGSRKIRAKYVYVGDGAPVEKSSSEQEEFIYPQQNAPQSHAGEMQPVSQSLQPSQTDFASDTALTQQQNQQPVYHQHPALNISQSWPLDLVQGTNHYTQGQPSSISHEQTNATHHLQDLHSQQQEQQRRQQQHHHHHQHHHVQQVQQTIIMDQTHNLEQQQGHLQPEVQQQNHHDHLNAQLATPQAGTNLASDNTNACASQDNNQSSSIDSDQNDDTSKEGCSNSAAQRKKKKGGKAKGTLETSVEIRNRMIGMSEAGLSTLSIALAIDRSERTVKRWLERWQREGNVQTKERKGRRRITTKEEDEAIIAMATQQPLTAAKHVAPALGLKCSVDTIRERLHKAGIHSWKLGKKQGEGNAVHTVHLWQPSGNRPNKPKLPGEKRRRSNGNRKRNQALSSTKKRSNIRKRKTESAAVKIVSPPTNMMSEQTAVVSFHNPGTMANYVSGTNTIQPVQNIAPPPPTVIQSQSHPSAAPPQATQSVQQIGSMMQQRPDCRLAPTIVAPVSVQANAAVAYPSCMVVATNANAGQMEQPDPLNYEPYIWTF